MGATEKRMEQLGIRLQQTDWRGKGTVDAVLAGDMLYLSAHYPVNEQGEPVYQGRVGAEVTQEEAYQAARLCGLNMLRTIQFYIGSLDRVDYFVKALGLVNSAGGLLQHARGDERVLRPDGGNLRPAGPPCPGRHGRLCAGTKHARMRGRHCPHPKVRREAP